MYQENKMIWSSIFHNIITNIQTNFDKKIRLDDRTWNCSNQNCRQINYMDVVWCIGCRLTCRDSFTCRRCDQSINSNKCDKCYHCNCSAQNCSINVNQIITDFKQIHSEDNLTIFSLIYREYMKTILININETWKCPAIGCQWINDTNSTCCKECNNTFQENKTCRRCSSFTRYKICINCRHCNCENSQICPTNIAQSLQDFRIIQYTDIIHNFSPEYCNYIGSINNFYGINPQIDILLDSTVIRNQPNTILINGLPPGYNIIIGYQGDDDAICTLCQDFIGDNNAVTHNIEFPGSCLFHPECILTAYSYSNGPLRCPNCRT
jgi:hypothetical protein